MTGWLAATFGRKRLLMSSVIGFHAGVVHLRHRTDLPFLVIFRIIQGATGGALQPLSQAVLLEAFPPHERGKAMGFWGLGIVVAPMLGPVLGGWLTDNYCWRWVFYVNIPVGIVLDHDDEDVHLRSAVHPASVPANRLLGHRNARRRYRRAAVRARQGTAGRLVRVVFHNGTDDRRVVILVAFIIHELRIEDPVIDLRVFKARTYSTGVFLMTDAGLCAVRQPGPPSVVASDGARLSVLSGRHSDGSARNRFVHRHADRRHADGGSILARWSWRVSDRRRYAVLARRAEPERRLLGHFLAAVHSGRGVGAAVRAVDDRER